MRGQACRPGGVSRRAAAVIAVTTLLCSLVGSFLGKGFGSLLKSKAEIFGGVILVLIGLKILLEHTLLA